MAKIMMPARPNQREMIDYFSRKPILVLEDPGETAPS